VNPQPFSHLCARISAELMAAEIEKWQAQIADPQLRAFLVALYRLAMADDDEK
jgi:hypothetical protein